MTYLIMQMLLCLLLAFLLGLLLGWWLGRRKLEDRIEEIERSWKGKLDRNHKDLEASRAEGKRLAAAAGDCEKALAKSKSELRVCQGELEECLAHKPVGVADLGAEAASADDTETAAVAVAAAALADTAPLEAPRAKDDLTRIEGIGPKIAGLLNGQDIATWARLAETEIPALQSILDDAGPRYRVHDPATWPQQAALAAVGSWDELEALQDRLKGGRDVAEVAPDDLKVVEGIGPKIEGLLNAGGIWTWSQLAKAEVSFLQSVLDKAGPRYRIHDPSTWPNQARLAAAGSWDELEKLQDRLKGGREA